jgi:hypothetical protein
VGAAGPAHDEVEAGGPGVAVDRLGGIVAVLDELSDLDAGGVGEAAADGVDLVPDALGVAGFGSTGGAGGDVEDDESGLSVGGGRPAAQGGCPGECDGEGAAGGVGDVDGYEYGAEGEGEGGGEDEAGDGGVAHDGVGGAAEAVWPVRPVRAEHDHIRVGAAGNVGDHRSRRTDSDVCAAGCFGAAAGGAELGREGGLGVGAGLAGGVHDIEAGAGEASELRGGAERREQ